MIIRFFKDFYLGIISFFQGIALVYKHDIWVYFIIPAILSLAIYVGKTYLGKDLENITISGIGDETSDLEILIIGLKAIGYFIANNLSKNVVLILLVPLLAVLSVKTEKILTGNKYPFSLKQTLRDIRRGANIAATNLIIQMLFIAAWYLLTLIIPQLSPASPIVVFCIGFYFYGFSFMDYANERRRLNIEESITFIRRHAGVAIAVGGIFSSIMLIPYGGIVIAPICGVVAATVAIHKMVDLTKNKFAHKDKPAPATNRMRKKN